MNKVIKKISAVAMAFTLCGVGVPAITKIAPKLDNTLVASANTGIVTVYSEWATNICNTCGITGVTAYATYINGRLSYYTAKKNGKPIMDFGIAYNYNTGHYYAYSIYIY